MLASSCAVGTGGSSATPTPTPTAAPTPTPPPSERLRWGYDPWQPTGERDPPFIFRPLPPGYRIETVVTGLDRPTQLVSLPDGRILITEQGGAVRVVQDGTLLPDPFVTVDVYLPELDSVVELGLTGIAVHPEFPEQPYIYLYYHTDGPRRSVLARVRDVDGRGVGLEELFWWEGAPQCCHIGGGMVFAPDGTLLLGMGDFENPNNAQDPLRPPGSILRLNPDGGWPFDNPFASPVYAYGLRNPYGLAVDPRTGRVFAGENGFFGQDAIIEVKAGANYGWPGFGLRVPLDEVEPPLKFYHTLAGIAGMEFYASDALPAFTGSLFFCQFHGGGALHEVTFDEDGSVASDKIVAPGCQTDVATGPEGFLYFLNYEAGVLYRIARAGS